MPEGSLPGNDTRLRDTLLIGADYYETFDEIDQARSRGLPPVGIGGDSIIERAIVDKNARIGRGVRILEQGRVQEANGAGWYVRDGIVIVPKNGVIPDGTQI